MRPPEFITFTGADDATDISGMAALSAKYPIEWGILFSPSRQGSDPRCPGGDAQSRFLHSGLRLSAHLCGGHSRKIMAGESIVEQIPVDLSFFKRVQVNHHAPVPRMITAFQHGWGKFRCIAQSRSDFTFPTNTSVDWLFDGSGGRGIRPTEWPKYPGRLVGYAGGIAPDNVIDILRRINATGPYWIDMESGVRTDNRFDLDLCRHVCEQVFK